MKERPILFSGPMIRPLLDDTKTQTRRLVTTRHPLTHIGPRGSQDDPSEWGYFFDGPSHHGYMVLGRGHNEQHNHGLISIPCPYGEVGDRLWVKETHAQFAVGDRRGKVPQCVAFRATCNEDGTFDYTKDGGEVVRLRVTKWTPSIFMPRWASRIQLEVTEVRVERLVTITEGDAKAEGVAPFFTRFPAFARDQQIIPDDLQWHCALASDSPYRASFATTWDEINGDRALWLTNPFVWAVTFKRIT